MATGWEALGDVLGGGIDKAGAYETGRYRSAQTENAIANARKTQLESSALEEKARARANVTDSMIKAGHSAEQATLLADLAVGEMGSDYAAGMEGQLRQQEFNFRNTVGDKSAPREDQFAAAQGIQGKALPRYEVSGGLAQDLLGEEQGVFANPVGQSVINANDALTSLRNVQAGDPDYRTASGSGGGTSGPPGIAPPPGGWPKLSPGEIYNTAFDATKPIGEGNYPIVNARPPTTGSIEHRMNQRMVRSVAQMVPDLANMLSMPASASLGILGTGTVPGASMLQASADALRNTITSDVARAYEAQSSQIGRAMAFIESNGSPPNETLLEDSIRAYSIRPGHTGFDVLRIFANLRQNVEQFNLVQQNDERVPADVRAMLKDLNETVQRTVPFTVEQVNALQWGGNNRRKTISDMMREYGFNAPPAGAGQQPAAGGAQPPGPPAQAPKPGSNFPRKNARGWQLQEDKNGNFAYVGPNGEVEEISSGL